jgi:hypothetical protein
MVLTDIMTDCTDHPGKCAVAKASYDPSLYVTFIKGDRLVLDTTKQSKCGWLYGKRENLGLYGKRENLASGHLIGSKRSILPKNEGYIHPLWVQGVNAFIGFLAMRFFGLVLTIVDMFLDFINGVDYIGIHKPSITNDSINCEELCNYSHPIWGSVGIGLIWLPALPIFINLISIAMQTYFEERDIRILLRKCFLAVLILITWPLSSIMMQAHISM